MEMSGQHSTAGSRCTWPSLEIMKIGRPARLQTDAAHNFSIEDELRLSQIRVILHPLACLTRR